MTARCLKALSLTVLCMPRSLAEPLVHGIPSCSELLTDNFVSSGTLDWAGSILLFLWDVRYGTYCWSPEPLFSILTLGESILHINVYTTLVIELSCSLLRPLGDYFLRIHLVIRTNSFVAWPLETTFSVQLWSSEEPSCSLSWPLETTFSGRLWSSEPTCSLSWPLEISSPYAWSLELTCSLLWPLETTSPYAPGHENHCSLSWPLETTFSGWLWSLEPSSSLSW
jgi:hypothetical protein